MRIANREWTAEDSRVKSRFDERSHLSIAGASVLILVAAGYYGLAFATKWGAAAILLALPCLFLLANALTARRAFYTGLAAGIAVYAPHLFFFWSVFGPAAIPLWLVAGMPIAIFTLLLFLTRKRLGTAWAAAYCARTLRPRLVLIFVGVVAQGFLDCPISL